MLDTEIDKDKIRLVVGMNKIKYNILNKIINNKIDIIHINIDSIINTLIKMNLNFTKHTYSYTLCAAILNIAAHYKHYFIKKKKTVTIFLYSNMNYNRDYKGIRFSLELIDIITKYLNKIYFIDTNKYLSDKVDNKMHLIIKYFSKDYNNLVITKDSFDLPLITDNISVLKLNKDKSILYNTNNFFDKYIKSKKHYNIPYSHISLFLAISGINKIKFVKGLGPNKIAKILQNGIECGNMSINKYNKIEHFYSDMKHLLPNSIYMNKDISNFYEKLDADILYNKYINKAIEKGFDNYIIDKFSYKDLIDLNNKYFLGLDYLMLDELTEEIVDDSKNNIKWW